MAAGLAKNAAAKPLARCSLRYANDHWLGEDLLDACNFRFASNFDESIGSSPIHAYAWDFEIGELHIRQIAFQRSCWDVRLMEDADDPASRLHRPPRRKSPVDDVGSIRASSR